MRIRRPQTSIFLLLCGVTLLVSIFVGERMGERVLKKTTETAVLVPEVTTPQAAPTVMESGPIRDWRKLRVVTVATDPGFPDPRVTKPPTPTPKPTRTPTPVPTETPFIVPTTPVPGESPSATPGAPVPAPTITTPVNLP
jgi:hypothetical protein